MMRKYMYNGREIKPTVEIYHDLVPYLGGICEKAFYTDIDKCVDAWRTTQTAVSDLFGDLLAVRTPSAPPLSYGHLVSLGVPLAMPEDAEPNVKPCVNSIEEGIEFLEARRDIDFADCDICRHYIAQNAALQAAFPEMKIAPLAGYSAQGVITTAVLLRGQDFFLDLYDEPEEVHTFLSLLNDSVISFRKFLHRTNGWAEVRPRGIGMPDDFASLIPPHMWSEFVIPYWKKYFDELTTGTDRFLHCENTTPAHLRWLKDAGITRYQPSVADALTIESIRENTDIPFDWLLYAYRITEMADAEIEAWVDATVEAGITTIRTQFGKYAWSTGKMDRIFAFYRAFEKYRVE